MNNKTNIANLHLNKSVLKVFNTDNNNLMGVKNTNILKPTVKYLSQFGYELHTIDKKSYLNRAIDLDLINPLSGNYLSGSSSGTALNVFLDINDIGIGSDGGGSVLAPAINLNLYSFISQNLPIKEVTKESTDKITFSVSAGIISKDINKLIEIYNDLYDFEQVKGEVFYLKSDDDPDLSDIKCNIVEFDKHMSREDMINFCKPYYEKGIIISHESRIDIYGLGDSIIGSLDKEKQILGNKGLIRIINMCSADAFVIPTKEISSGFVISTTKYYSQLIDLLANFELYNNALTDRYYSSDNYIKDNYEE